jgi:hypothetical protein
VIRWGNGDLGFFFSLNINGRAGGYPPDKKLKTRSPPETRMRKIIISVIRPYMTHGRAAGRTGRAVLSGGSVFTGFCPPLDKTGYKQGNHSVSYVRMFRNTKIRNRKNEYISL